MAWFMVFDLKKFLANYWNIFQNIPIALKQYIADPHSAQNKVIWDFDKQSRNAIIYRTFPFKRRKLLYAYMRT